MTSESWTVGRLLQWTNDYLQGHGSDSPRLDAEVLLANALGCQRIDLYTRFEEMPGEEARAAFRELVRQRSQGMPVAYLVGRREFYSLSFRVTRDVLILRPETELLVVAALDLAKVSARGLAIADVGTGSGIIAICLAKHLPKCRLTAIDRSGAAIRVARQNAADHGVTDRIEFLESDLLDALTEDRKFDIIVSNPPYVTAEEYATLAADVREYEPRDALVSGPKGTEVIERLIVQAADRLDAGGHLLMEIGPAIHDAVRALFQADARWEPGETIKDLARLPRVVRARRR